MSELKDILEGYNSGYILQQKRPQIFKQLEEPLQDIQTPFFEAFNNSSC